MRILSAISSVGITFAVLCGAAHAETTFPNGIAGSGDFELFPRWERVMSSTRGQTETMDARPEGAPAATPTFTVSTSRSVTTVPKAPFMLPQPSALGPLTAFRNTPMIPIPRQRPQTDATVHRAPPTGATVEVEAAASAAAAGCHETGSCGLADWQSVVQSVRTLSPSRQLAEINSWANRITYVDDASNWAMADYWQTPGEFIARGGDCEDYAILKYFGLVDLGFEQKDLRILVLFDEELKLHHSVLLVQLNGEIWVLDNQRSSIVSLSDVPHYRAIYSVNADNWWMHKTLAPVRLAVAAPARASVGRTYRRRLR